MSELWLEIEALEIRFEEQLMEELDKLEAQLETRLAKLESQLRALTHSPTISSDMPEEQLEEICEHWFREPIKSQLENLEYRLSNLEYRVKQQALGF